MFVPTEFVRDRRMLNFLLYTFFKNCGLFIALRQMFSLELSLLLKIRKINK